MNVESQRQRVAVSPKHLRRTCTRLGRRRQRCIFTFQSHAGTGQANTPLGPEPTHGFVVVALAKQPGSGSVTGYAGCHVSGQSKRGLGLIVRHSRRATACKLKHGMRCNPTCRPSSSRSEPQPRPSIHDHRLRAVGIFEGQGARMRGGRIVARWRCGTVRDQNPLPLGQPAVSHGCVLGRLDRWSCGTHDLLEREIDTGTTSMEPRQGTRRMTQRPQHRQCTLDRLGMAWRRRAACILDALKAPSQHRHNAGQSFRATTLNTSIGPNDCCSLTTQISNCPFGFPTWSLEAEPRIDKARQGLQPRSPGRRVGPAPVHIARLQTQCLKEAHRVLWWHTDQELRRVGDPACQPARDKIRAPAGACAGSVPVQPIPHPAAGSGPTSAYPG